MNMAHMQSTIFAKNIVQWNLDYANIKYHYHFCFVKKGQSKALSMVLLCKTKWFENPLDISLI